SLRSPSWRASQLAYSGGCRPCHPARSRRKNVFSSTHTSNPAPIQESRPAVEAAAGSKSPPTRTCTTKSPSTSNTRRGAFVRPFHTSRPCAFGGTVMVSLLPTFWNSQSPSGSTFSQTPGLLDGCGLALAADDFFSGGEVCTTGVSLTLVLLLLRNRSAPTPTLTRIAAAPPSTP